MGNKISTPKILPYAVAQKRFESEEWAALDAGFSRLCNEDGLLEAREFRLHVLGLHVPATMGSSLFYTFNSKRLDGISRKEFLSGVSILLRGTNKERVALVFATFDEDRNGKISRRDVDTWLQICKQNMVDTQFVESLKDLFDEQDSSEYEYGYHQAELDHRQFEDWCNGYFAEDQVIPAIISWAWDLLRDERLFGVSEDSLFRARRGRDAGVPDKLWKRKHESTAFNEKEVAELEQTYHRLRVASPNLAVSELLREIFPPRYMVYVCVCCNVVYIV
jgi:Ca2+-binding EF-hand superfamily protein